MGQISNEYPSLGQDLPKPLSHGESSVFLDVGNYYFPVMRSENSKQRMRGNLVRPKLFLLIYSRIPSMFGSDMSLLMLEQEYDGLLLELGEARRTIVNNRQAINPRSKSTQVFLAHLLVWDSRRLSTCLCGYGGENNCKGNC